MKPPVIFHDHITKALNYFREEIVGQSGWLLRFVWSRTIYKLLGHMLWNKADIEKISIQRTKNSKLHM